METKIKNLAKVIETKKQTFDYLKYTYLAGVSRKVDDNHVKTIMESMLTFGAETTTLIVLETNAFGKKMRILADGNHRGESGRLLNLPLDIKVVKLNEDTIANVKMFIAFLNNNLKKWTNPIYLEVFAEGGVYEYVKFKQILSETDLSITDLLHIYCGSGSTKKFQSGELKFNNEKDSDKLLAEVKRMREFIPNYSFTRRSIWKFTKPKFINGDYKKLSNAIIKFSKDSKNGFSADEKTFKQQVQEIWTKTFDVAK